MFKKKELNSLDLKDINRLRANNSLRKIAKKYNTTHSTIIKRLKESGYYSGFNNKKLFENYILNEYKRSKDINKIGKNNNIYPSIIKGILKKNNVDGIYKRKYPINYDYFSKVNVNNSYFAGLIAADGCVYNNVLSLELHKQDIDILNKFSNDIEYNGKLYYRKNRNTVTLPIRSKQVAKDLSNNFNIVENKTHILIAPNISKKFVPHFIRGYIDGDGSYCSTSYNISIRGTENLLSWIKDNLKQNIEIGNPGIYFESGQFKIQFQGKLQCRKIINFLYKDADIFIKRKCEIIKNNYLRNEK